MLKQLFTDFQLQKSLLNTIERTSNYFLPPYRGVIVQRVMGCGVTGTVVSLATEFHSEPPPQLPGSMKVSKMKDGWLKQHISEGCAFQKTCCT